MGIDLHTLLIYILFVSTLIIDISVLAMTPRTPKLVAFDLDGTVWTPDMYMLWGGGAQTAHFCTKYVCLVQGTRAALYHALRRWGGVHI